MELEFLFRFPFRVVIQNQDLIFSYEFTDTGDEYKYVSLLLHQLWWRACSSYLVLVLSSYFDRVLSYPVKCLMSTKYFNHDFTYSELHHFGWKKLWFLQSRFTLHDHALEVGEETFVEILEEIVFDSNFWYFFLIFYVLTLHSWYNKNIR